MTTSQTPIHSDEVVFTTLSIPAIRARPDLLPEAPGVYVALFPDGLEFLAKWGYFSHDHRSPSVIGGHPVLYAGMTSKLGMRQRIDNHLRGDARVSSLRMSLGTILRKKLKLRAFTSPRKTYFHFGEGEARLSDWMAGNLLFAVAACENPLDVEKHMIRGGVFPLNITDRRAHPFSRHLMAMRHDMVARHRPEELSRARAFGSRSGPRP